MLQEESLKRLDLVCQGQERLGEKQGPSKQKRLLRGEGSSKGLEVMKESPVFYHSEN